MPTIAKYRRPVKPYRVSDRRPAPFGQGLEHHPLPAEPIVDAMPRPVRVRWAVLDLTPLEDDDGGLLEPEPQLTLSGSWAMPGEEHSWDYGHSENV